MDRSLSHNGLIMGHNGYTIPVVRRRSTRNYTTLGIDLAKQVFQLHGVDERGRENARPVSHSTKIGSGVVDVCVGKWSRPH
jgi:hypothetical protein